MNSSSNSSGKRSVDGINDTTNSASDGGVALGGDNSKSAGICNDALKKFLKHQTLR